MVKPARITKLQPLSYGGSQNNTEKQSPKVLQFRDPLTQEDTKARNIGSRKRSSVSRLSNNKEDLSQIEDDAGKIQYGDYKYLKFVKRNSVQNSEKPSQSDSTVRTTDQTTSKSKVKKKSGGGE